MKTLLIGDLHFGVYQNNEKFLNHQLTYLKSLQEFILEQNIKEICVLGDFFDNRKSTNNYVLTETTNKFFNWFNENKITLYAIMGNHDMVYTKETTHSPLYSFQSKYIKVINESYYDKERDFLYCSYNFDFDNLEDKDYSNTVLFCHVDIIGAKMNNTRLSESGYDPKIFKQFKKVYSGHYHSPSEIDNIKYIGSPFQLDFNNFGEIHGVNILDGDEEVFFENTTSPKFINVTYNGSNNITISGLVETDLQFSSIKDALEWITDNYCKLIVRKVDNQIEFNNFKSKIEVREYINLEILTDKFSTDKMSLYNIKDVETLLKEFFTNLVLSESLESQKLLKVFFHYYNHVIDNRSMYSLLTDELKFNYVEFENFLSYQNKTRIDFEKGMFRLIGENGAGKTSGIIEGLNFLLFGTSLLGKNKPSMINIEVGKKLKVQGEFSVADNTYKVIRGMKPNIFEIYKNDDPKPIPMVANSSDDYQKILNTFIGINQKQLQYLLLKNKKIYKPFSTMSTPEKREFIEKMFNIDVFGEILTLIKLDLTQNKIDIDLTWKDVQKWEDLIKQEEQHIIKLEEIELQKINKDITKLQQEISQIEDDKTIKSLKLNLNTQRDMLNSLREAINIKSLESSLSDLNTFIDTLKESGKDYIISLNQQIKDKTTDLESEIDFEPIDNKIKSQEQNLESKKSSLNELTLSLSELNENVKDKKELEDELSDKEKSEKILNERFHFQDNKKTELKTKIKEAEDIISKMSGICGDCLRVPEIQKNYNIEQLKKDIEQIDLDKRETLDNIDEIHDEKDTIKKEIKSIEETFTNIQYKKVLIESITKEISSIEKMIKDYETEKEDLKTKFESNKSKVAIELENLQKEKKKYIDDVAEKIKEKKTLIEKKEDEISLAKESNEIKIKEKKDEIILLEKDLDEHREQKVLEKATKEREVEILTKSKDEINIVSEEMVGLKKSLKLEQQLYEERNTEFKHLDFLRKMLMSDDSIKSFIIGQYIDFINYEFNMNLAKFNVPFALMFDKNLNQEFMGEYSVLGYDNLSSGEEKSIDFSLMFTFDTLQEKLFNRKINVVVFDEILSGLDTNRTRIAFEELKRMSADKSVWIVEHLFEYDVDKTYLVTKDEKGSKITEEK